MGAHSNLRQLSSVDDFVYVFTSWRASKQQQQNSNSIWWKMWKQFYYQSLLLQGCETNVKFKNLMCGWPCIVIQCG